MTFQEVIKEVFDGPDCAMVVSGSGFEIKFDHLGAVESFVFYKGCNAHVLDFGPDYTNWTAEEA